jgi:hypothetical protein
MDLFYDLIGRLLFRREQRWRQRQSARLMTGVVVFSLLLGYVLMKLIKMMYNHAK